MGASRKSHEISQLTDGQLLCRQFSHDFSVFVTDKDWVTKRGQIVAFTRVLDCSHGCGVRAEEDIDTRYGREGKRRLDYTDAHGYLMSKATERGEFIVEWYQRHPPKVRPARQRARRGHLHAAS